jgi:hypothetical protein
MTVENLTIQQIEEKTFEGDDNSEVPPADIIAYNEPRSCSDLFRLFSSGQLDLSPHFQRDKVWNPSEQTRFIDSLIKGLPIPSMCLSFDIKRECWIVIDGLQRISTIVRFLSETDEWRLSKLDDIDKKISGQKVSVLRDKNSSLRKLYNRIENISIPTTVLRCDMEKKNHSEYIFTIFHRLNTGGTKLNNQEIRNCIFSGDFNKLLQDLDTYPKWRKLNRMKKNENHRFTKQEIILRLFTFNEKFEEYDGKLSKFLNEYMKDYRNPDEIFLNSKRNIFLQTVDIIVEKIFDGKQPKALSISVEEALLVGVSKNIDSLKLKSNKHVQNQYHNLLAHEAFSETKLREGLSGKQRLIDRISTAIDIFAN